MAQSIAQLKKYRSRFGWAFLISFVVLLVSILFLSEHQTPEKMKLDLPSQSAPPPAAGTVSLPTLVSVASLLTSATSLIGFFFTTGIARRRERREQHHADIDLEKKRLEVEKLRLEVERKKQGSSPGNGNSNDVA